MQEISQLISTVGFPIAVSLILMYQNQKLTDVVAENTKTIAELKTVISEHLERCNGGNTK